jgi:hypothetical protein
MERASDFPKQDFEGFVYEIWQGLGACFYHAAYVGVYADSEAMHLAGSPRRLTIIQAKSQTEREQLQEDLIVFRAHFAGVLWQLHHLADELLRVAYRRCKQQGIVTKDWHDALVKALDDDPIIKEIRDYRNLSHQLAGVIVTMHDPSTFAFIAHVFPPLHGKPPEQNQQEVPLDEPEVQARELNTKLQTYCKQLGGYCEGLFKIIDAKYKASVLPRIYEFSVTNPHSYRGRLPLGAEGVTCVNLGDSAKP